MNAKPLRQLHDREWGRMVLHAARLPHSLWNERLFSPLVRFLFFGVPAYAFDIAQTEVVDERLVALVDSPANGVTFCTGSLGALPENDLPAMVRRLAAVAPDRIHFAHCRNVRVTGERRFHETSHPSAYGGVDLAAVLRALRDVGFTGPMRPDHGRMIWGESGRPGYGLYDRALGATYLQGLWEGLSRETSS